MHRKRSRPSGSGSRAQDLARPRSAQVKLATAALLVFIALPALAQQRTLPRAWDGKPDLSGVWQALTTANFDIQDHSARLGVPAGQGIVEGNEIPYQPWVRAKKEENFKNRDTLDHEAKCFLLGVP